ncbi:MAG: porin [Amphritea sp.]|nr:porin [Amphritea sp.]
MKKSLIALAVAGAMTAPMVAQADATLYGKFEMRVVSAKDKALEVQSDDFRIGLKGDSELNSGAKALYGFEMEYNPDSAGGFTSHKDAPSNTASIRKAFVGAAGDFGTVLIGRIANPAEAVVAKVGNWSESASGFAYDQNPDFLGSTIAYVTPDMGGFNGYAALIAEGGDDNGAQKQENNSGYLVGGNFGMDALSISAAYWTLNDNYTKQALSTIGADDSRTWAGISAAYDFGGVNVALGYSDLEAGLKAKDPHSVKTTSLLVSGKVSDVTLWANYHDYNYEVKDTNVSDKVYQYDNEFGLGAAYSLGAQASLDVEYTSADGIKGTGTKDNNIFSVGYTVKF